MSDTDTKSPGLVARARELLKKVAEKNPKGRRFDEHGRFYPDPQPIAPPAGFVRQKSLHQQIAEAVASAQFNQLRAAQGEETFEEADDFDVGDDYDPRTPWEENFYGEFDIPVEYPPPPVQAGPAERPPGTSSEVPPSQTAPGAPGGGPGAVAGGGVSPPRPADPPGRPTPPDTSTR